MRNKGIALITVLMVVSLLLGLVGAFLGVNQASSQLTGNSLQRRRAQDACLTALNYAWGRLEADRTWGVNNDFGLASPKLYPSTAPRFQFRQDMVDGQMCLIGQMHESGDFASSEAVTVTVKVYNNLNSRLALPGDVPTPPHACRLLAVAQIGSTQRHLDTILRQAPLTHDSMSAGKDAFLAANDLLRVESRDPYVNKLEAGGDLNLPAEDVVRFAGGGQAASSKKLMDGSLDLATAPDSRVRQANSVTGGRFEPNSKPPIVPKFSKDNFKLPTTVSEVPAGNYKFGGIDYEEYKPAKIEYEEHKMVAAGPPDPTTGVTPMKDEVTKGDCERHQKVTAVYDQLKSPDGKTWVAANARAGTTVVDPPNLPAGPLGSQAAAQSWGYSAAPGGFAGGVTPVAKSDVHEIYPGVWANVLTGQMAIRSGIRAHSPGSFTVTAAGSRPPEILFGYQFTAGGVAQEESLRDGLTKALDSPQSYMAALEAAGTIDIPGGVLGYGSMIAGGDLTVKASSGLRAAPQLGVIVKGRNVIINPATEPEPGLPGEPVSIDYGIYKTAITKFSNGNTTPYDNWLSLTAKTRFDTSDALKQTMLVGDAATYWGQLNTELNKGLVMPSPADLGPGWGPNISLGQYTRLKEFYQTLATGYNKGKGDLTWLDMNQHDDDSAARVSNCIGQLSQWANSYKKTLMNYLANPAPQAPDMFYQGLVFADQDLTVNAAGKYFRLEGSVVAGNNLKMEAKTIELVYDRNMLDDLTKSNVGANNLKLEKIYFTLY